MLLDHIADHIVKSFYLENALRTPMLMVMLVATEIRRSEILVQKGLLFLIFETRNEKRTRSHLDLGMVGVDRFRKILTVTEASEANLK
jgi:hypothetical protein